MKRTIHITALLLFVLSFTVYPQTSNSAKSLPKLLSLREQQAVRESWLKKRLDTMLLPMMRQQKIEMWIVTNEEFHADPVTAYIAPPLPYVGRRDYFILADRGGDKLDRITIVRYPEEHLKYFYEVLESTGQRNWTNTASHRRRAKSENNRPQLRRHAWSNRWSYA